jgi:predicted dehydrogenase
MGALHARVLAQHPSTVLATVVDPDEAAGRQLAETHGAAWAPDLDAAVDAAVVASPTETHVTWAQRLLDAGVPTLVEKPVSTRVDETRAVVAAAERGDVPLMCGLLERFNPVVATALEIADAPVHVSVVRHSPYVERIRTGVALDLLIHDVDLALRIAGRRPDGIMAHVACVHPKSEPGAEDVAEVTLRYDDGLLVSLSASRLSQRKVRSLWIAELDRMVEVDMLRHDITVYRHVGNEMIGDDGRGYRQQTIMDIPVVPNVREPLAVQLDRFVALARGDLDAAVERASIVPPHEVVAEALAVAAGARHGP